MAEVTLRPDAVSFPSGTVVKVYECPWPPPGGGLSGEPGSTKVAEVEVVEGTLAVAGLNEGQRYVGWAVTEEADRYVYFDVEAPGPEGVSRAVTGEWHALTAKTGTTQGEPPAEARTEQDGAVARLRGVLKQTAEWTEGTEIAVVPAECRPAGDTPLSAFAFAVGEKEGLPVRLLVQSSGAVKVAAGGVFPSTGRLLKFEGATWALA